MTNIQQNWWAADFAGLAGRKAPVAAFLNGAAVYGAFPTLSFAAGSPSPANGGPYVAPGGTIYRPGGNDMYFPQATTGAPSARALRQLRRARAGLRAGLLGGLAGA